MAGSRRIESDRRRAGHEVCSVYWLSGPEIVDVIGATPMSMWYGADKSQYCEQTEGDGQSYVGHLVRLSMDKAGVSRDS